MLRYCSVICLMLIVRKSAASEDCPSDRQQKDHYEARLLNDLLCAYKPYYRPVKYQNSTVDVRVALDLKYFSFDALEESFMIQSYVNFDWKDEYLSWSPSDYGGITKIQIHSYKIWTPRMMMFNSDIRNYYSYKIYTTCILDSSGLVTCAPNVAYTGICSTSLRKWPYDTQNCSLYLGSWVYSGEQVNFTFYERPLVLDNYQDGPGWKLLAGDSELQPGKYNCCLSTTYPVLKYTFILKRESAGLAATLVVPAITIVVLTLKGMLTEIKNNKRMAMLCFSMLTHFLCVIAISLVIPKFGSDTPIILLFIRDSMFVTLLGLLTTLLLISLNKRTKPAPEWILTFNQIVTSGPGKYLIFTEFNSNEDFAKNILIEDTSVNNEKLNVVVSWVQFTNITNAFAFILISFIYLILITGYIPRDA